MMAEKLFTAKSRDDLRNDTKGRQNHDVDFGMAEEPEKMLEHHWIAAAGRIEEGGSKMAIKQDHGDDTGQHWHSANEQESRDQPGPDKKRHFHQGHARRAQV